MTTPMNERDVLELVPGDIVMVRPYDEISPTLLFTVGAEGKIFARSSLHRDAPGKVWMKDKTLKESSGKKYCVDRIEKRNHSYFGTDLVVLKHIKSGRKIAGCFVPEWLSKEVIDEAELSSAFSKLFRSHETGKSSSSQAVQSPVD